VNVSILPRDTLTYDLGSLDFLWNNIYANGLILGTRDSGATLQLYYWAQNNWSHGYDVFKRGNVDDIDGAVYSGAELGYHGFYGWDGAQYVRGAFLLARATENWGSGHHGARLEFYTTTSGGGGAYRVVIDHDGTFRPYADDTYDLGSSSYRWKNGYFAGKITIDTGIDAPGVSFGYNNSSNAFSIYESGGELYIEKSGTNQVNIWENLEVWGNITPHNDNAWDFGSSSLRWKNGYFAGLLDIGSLRIGGTEVIDASRNIKEIFDIIPAQGTTTTGVTTTFIWDLFIPYKFSPKTYDYNTNLITLYYWDDGSGTWVDDTSRVSSTGIAKVFRGDVTGAISIPYQYTSKYRIRIPNDGAYRYIHAIHIAYNTHDNRFKVKVYGVKTDTTEVLIAESNRKMSGWPGHSVMILKNYLRWHPSSDYTEIILEFEITWGSGGYTVDINKIQLWGMYPYNAWFRRFYVDENMNTRFGGGVLPNDDNSYDLGSSSLRWKDIYFAGNLEGTNWHIKQILVGTTASRPSAGVAYRLYISTDEEIIYLDDGSSWIPLGAVYK